MSFVIRRPLRSKSETLRTHKKIPSKKSQRKLKPWDDSVQDLTKFKPSSEDLERNHQLHLPKKDHERLRQRIQSRQFFLEDEKENDNIFQGAPLIFEKKRALIKEKFYNQEKELRDVLAETDRTIANVQDLFGDDVQRYRVFPHITRAPTMKQNKESFLSSYGRTPSYEFRESALNLELNAVSDDEESKSTKFKSKIDLDRYQKILKESDANKWEKEASSVVESLSKIMQGFTEEPNRDKEDMQLIDVTDDDQMNHDDVRKDDQTVNKNQNQKSELSKSNDPHPSSQSFNDMKKLLDMLEIEISEYEKAAGQKAKPNPIKIPSTLTGYTANLLSAVIRITRYLKESEVQLRAEMLMRKEIVDALEEQRDLIDALTADLIETQETNDSLKKIISEQNKTNEKQHRQLCNDFHRLERKLDSFLMHFDAIEKIETSEDTLGSLKSAQDDQAHSVSSLKYNGISPKISPIHF